MGGAEHSPAQLPQRREPTVRRQSEPSGSVNSAPPTLSASTIASLQRTAGNTAVRHLVRNQHSVHGIGVRSSDLAPVSVQTQVTAPVGKAGDVKGESLADQVISGKSKDVLFDLNGRSMDDILVQLEKLGFANASYLLANLGAANALGPHALARMEAALRSYGSRQTGSSRELLYPLFDAVNRSGIRKFSDQIDAVRRTVAPPAGGWPTLAHQYLQTASLAPFAVLTSADDMFRLLDFVSDQQVNVILTSLSEIQLRLLISSINVADRYDGERIRRALDAAWRSKFPKVEPPWPKPNEDNGVNVAAMSPSDKLLEAIKRSEKYAGDELRGKIEELIQPKAIAFMVGTLIVFALLEAGTGGTAGAVLLVASVLMVGPEVVQVVGDINGFITTALGAQDGASLDLAAQYFAKAAVAIGIDVLTAILLHKTAKTVNPKIQATGRRATEFLKSQIRPGAPPSQLYPALAIGGEGMPRFVEAPPERLVPLESKGGGAKPDYSSMTPEQLKKLAKADKKTGRDADKEAWYALIDRYRSMSDAELRQLANKKRDADARAVLNERTSPNSEALKKALGSDYRPPHTAEVTVRRGSQVVAQEQYNSGNMTPPEAALGWPRSSLATHTEARAVNRPDLQPGDIMTIMGQYDPCSSCQNAMTTAARWLGITIHYVWPGGRMTFRGP